MNLMDRYNSVWDGGPSNIAEVPGTGYQDSKARVSSSRGSKSKVHISKNKHRKHPKKHKVEKKLKSAKWIKITILNWSMSRFCLDVQNFFLFLDRIMRS